MCAGGCVLSVVVAYVDCCVFAHVGVYVLSLVVTCV